jgi:hypothetical protein
MHISRLGSLAVGSFLLIGSSLTAKAAISPVLQYSFPASWNGTGTTVTDQSAAGNNGTIISSPVLSSTAVPPGAPAGTDSITTNAGAILTNANDLLDNIIVAPAGGFSYNVDFMWDGTDTTSNGHVQKIIDYAGTESLQLTTAAGGAATLQLIFTTEGLNGNPDVSIGPSLPVISNTWYDVSAIFNTQGNTVSGVDGSLAGLATLDAGPVGGATASSSLAVVKTTYGDGLDRPIGVGQLGANFGHLVYLRGDIYNPTVDLGVLPEPASLSLLALLAPTLLGRRSRRA